MADPLEALRTRVGASVRQLIGGTSEAPERPVPPDGGLFGPTSVTWRVHADPSMFIGGIRALLLQTLHPPTMAGVAQHSAYEDDPLGRLHRTAQFLGTTTFGTVAEADAAIAGVRAIHDRVSGTTRDGAAYSANDPHLLRWVHLTEVDSFARAYRRYGSAPFGPADLDAYVNEMAVVAERLGATGVPRSGGALADRLEAYRPELAVGPDARRAMRFLSLPPLPLAARAPYGILFGAAVGLLPGWARRKLWLPVLPVTERVIVRSAATALLRSLGWVLQPRATAKVS